MRDKWLIFFTILLLSTSLTVRASSLSVAVDIAPLNSLVSQVMDGVGKPSLLIPPEVSPHRHTLRPSEAQALADATLVFWMGEAFTPWLAKALNNIASSAQKVEVLQIAGTTIYPFRESTSFESHEANHHSQVKDHHEHQGEDPHAWLDPENAKIWIENISVTLSSLDPENEVIYRSNAVKARAALDALILSTRTRINRLDKPKFIVFHDAYQYFEKRFGISAMGSISLSDAEDPSPARIKAIRDGVKKLGVTCVFAEPQYNPGLVKNVFADTNITHIGIMDPLGANLTPGGNHYPSLIEGMVDSLSGCQ